MGGCNVCDGSLGLHVRGKEGGCNCDGFLQLNCEGRIVDAIVVRVSWSLMCESRTVDVIVVRVCWSLQCETGRWM